MVLLLLERSRFELYYMKVVLSGNEPLYLFRVAVLCLVGSVTVPRCERVARAEAQCVKQGEPFFPGRWLGCA